MKARDLQQPHKSGSGCLIMAMETDRFLLIQRSEYVPMPLTWALPGGKVDPGEKPSVAARREVFEEIGFDIGDRPLRLIYTNDAHAPRFRFYTYACVVEKQFQPTLNWESSGHVWCDIDSLPEPLHWGVSQMINHDSAAKILKKFVEDQKRSA